MKKHPILFTLPFLTACSLGVYGDDFECDPSQGMGCKSVSAVNKAITKKEQICSCSTPRIYLPAYVDGKGHTYEGAFVTLSTNKGGSI